MGQKPNWRGEELSYLAEMWGTISVEGIARKLGRSVSAVKLKAGRLKLGPASLAGGYITLNQLLIAVRGNNGGGGYVVESWCNKRGLPYHEKKIVREKVRIVYLEEFWDWAKKNRSFIDFSKFQPLALGEEPDWVAEQRRKDFQSCGIQRKDPWSQEDDSRLRMLLKQHKYGYAELSEMLRRSAGAIQHRCMYLGLKERPVKADNHGAAAQWSEEDYAVLAEGIRNGDSYGTIARKIGKSEKSIRGKVYVTYFTEDADKVRVMLGDGVWGENPPIPKVRQALHVSGYRADVRDLLERLAGVLYSRTAELKKVDYDWFFQRKVCEKWNELDGICTAGCTDCDACTEFVRIRPQYCARCGGTFYEKQEMRFCPKCISDRKKSTRRKWAILQNRRITKND